MAGKVKDLTGQKFGKLTVLKLDHIEKRKSFWLCQCECGNTTVVRSDCLKSGTGRPVTISCGCYNKSKKSFYIDGRSKDKLYHVFYGILQRCNNPKANHYKDYGGRGIKVLWRNWDEFRDWSLANGYKEGLTIERINNDGNYEPSNCRWATLQEQQPNKRPRCVDILTEVNGKKVNLVELSKLTGIKYGTLYYRYTHNPALFTQSVTTIAKASTPSIDTVVEAGGTPNGVKR